MPSKINAYFVVFLSFFAYVFVPYNRKIPVTNNIVEWAFSVFENVYIRPPWKCPVANTSTACEIKALERLRFVFSVTKYVPTWGSTIRERTIFINQDGTDSAVATSLPVVLYDSKAYPESNVNSQQPPSKRTLLLWFHYGGYVVGHAKDGLIYQLAKMLLAEDKNVLVASVEYRLSPEYSREASVRDCFYALKFFSSASVTKKYNLDEKRYIVGGASAGGGLAAEIALKAAVESIELKAHIAVVPMLTPYAAIKSWSYVENAQNFGLSTQAILWYWKTCTKGETNRPFVSLVDAVLGHKVSNEGTDFLQHVSDSLVITARSDVLNDEGIDYVETLQKHAKNRHVHQHKLYRTTHLGSMIYPSHWEDIIAYVREKSRR